MRAILTAFKRLIARLRGPNGHELAEPIVAAEWRQRGNALLKLEKLAEAEQCYRAGIKSDPSDPICYANLGYVLLDQKRWDEAANSLSKAVKLDPTDHDSVYLLANLNRDRGDVREAVGLYRRALALSPQFAECRRDLCLALARVGEIQEAKATMAQGPTFGEDRANYYRFRGALHLESTDYRAAAADLFLANQLKPHDAVILLNLASAQIAEGYYIEGLRATEEALALGTHEAESYANLAAAYRMTGDSARAIECYRSSLRIEPQYLYVHQNLLFELSTFSGCTPEEYLSEARIYGGKVAARAKPFSKWLCDNSAEQGRPLRIGFLSADLCLHPVGLFLASVLRSLDSSRVTTIAYSCGHSHDAHSERLKKLFAEWNRVPSKTDQELAEKIHSDRIDLLVDLSGHSGQTRLPVFAWKPAPVQVAWLGFWASTGVAEIDYILVDSVGVRAGEEHFFSETPWFLPETRLCFGPPPTSWQIAVGDLPAIRNGYLTFGSYQQPNKISQASLTLWSKVLHAIPAARLRLHGLRLDNEAIVSDVKQRLVRANIDLARVALLERANYEAYLESYAEVDVVLDTQPYPGGTKTAEGLWMGVPTLTLTGGSHMARQGEGLLRCAGLADWVASSEQAYVSKAVEKAADLSALAALRTNLRAQVLASPVFDSERFARDLENAFDGMVKAKKHGNSKSTNDAKGRESPLDS